MRSAALLLELKGPSLSIFYSPYSLRITGGAKVEHLITTTLATFSIEMPPQLTDDEQSASSDGEVAASIAKPSSQDNEGKAHAVIREDEQLMVESEREDEEDEEEVGEGEYVVEKITSHLVDEDTGELRFEVKWEGYEKKSDRTWEPEENLLETASKILNEYLASVGGKDAILEAWQAKKAAKKGKKRARTSTTGENGTNGAKRGRKTHPASASPPASATKAEFKPPTGSWEEAVVAIDACEGKEGDVIVYLTWTGGEKTQHPLPQVYKRCPQKMLAFYESHLVFKKNDEPTKEEDF